MRPRVLSLLAILVSLAAVVCGGISQGVNGDGGEDVNSGGGEPDARAYDAGASDDGGHHHNPGSGDAATGMGGGPVDAGYYYGDSSFWVEGGAYPGLGAPDASVDGPSLGADSSVGCGALSACCPTLSASQQALCASTVAAGDAANCATELGLLQGTGSCSGVTVLTSLQQNPPHRMVSDGKLLFWTTGTTPGLLAMPVRGGAVTVLLSVPTADFLVVDDVNVYVLEGTSIVRIPKSGAPATLVNEEGASVQVVTSIGDTAYWIQNSTGGVPSDDCSMPMALDRAALRGTSIDTLLVTDALLHETVGDLAVTSKLRIVSYGSLYELPKAGMPVGCGDLAQIDIPTSCGPLTSDTNAIYCPASSGSNLRIASDGTTSQLGDTVNSSYIVFDDTNAYWADATTVGTIKKAPKAGGGKATILARDTNPTAVAVDATSVYWGDMGGYIKRIPK
jgi:hypothetical protein